MPDYWMIPRESAIVFDIGSSIALQKAPVTPYVVVWDEKSGCTERMSFGAEYFPPPDPELE